MPRIQVGTLVTVRHSCRDVHSANNEALWCGVAIRIDGTSVLVRFDCDVEDWYDANDLDVES